jgi:hypothetical protein
MSRAVSDSWEDPLRRATWKCEEGPAVRVGKHCTPCGSGVGHPLEYAPPPIAPLRGYPPGSAGEPPKIATCVVLAA